MKKLLKGLVIAGLMLVSVFVQAQSYDCDDLLDDIKYHGYFQSSEFGLYSSSAIQKLKWYEYQDRYFALIQFKNGYSSKVYVYGNWSYSEYTKIKREFKSYKLRTGSAGKAFWAWIQPNSRVGCETSKRSLY